METFGHCTKNEHSTIKFLFLCLNKFNRNSEKIKHAVL